MRASSLLSDHTLGLLVMSLLYRQNKNETCLKPEKGFFSCCFEVSKKVCQDIFAYICIYLMPFFFPALQAMGGGYLRWGHFEMMRLTINRHLNPRTMFAVWRVPAPYKPITRKGLGQRMGGGKGAIDHYVTAVKTGRLIVEVGGHCEFGEVERFLTQVAKKLPFPAKAVSRESLQEMQQREEERKLNNQNPWTFERIVSANMLGIRKFVSPYDLQLKGQYWGKFFLPDRV